MRGQSGCTRSKGPTSCRLSALCLTSEFGANPAVAQLVGCSAGGTANWRAGGGAGAGAGGQEEQEQEQEEEKEQEEQEQGSKTRSELCLQKTDSFCLDRKRDDLMAVHRWLVDCTAIDWGS